jgi:SAM-dependent methyltransferase
MSVEAATLVRKSPPESFTQQIEETRTAFDSVASTYDGPLGNNLLVQRMREQLRRQVLCLFPPGSRLLDIGCGTGLDALYFARRGYQVVAVDSSPGMVARTRARVAEADLDHRVSVRELGLQDICVLPDEPVDGLYSNLGPLNCAPHLRALAADCNALLRPGGYLLASVMGRVCPWEWLAYALQGNLARAAIRFKSGLVPVSLNGHTVWTRYLTPGEMVRAFEPHFTLTSCRALSLFLPPPYLVGLYSRHPHLSRFLGALDDHIGAWPAFRLAGDHVLVTLKRRA